MPEASDPNPSALALEILEAVEDGYVLLDGQFGFVYLNPAAERLLGMTMAELAGKSPWEAFPATAGTALEATLRQAMADGIAVSAETFHTPTRKWHAVTATPFRQGGLIVRLREAGGPAPRHDSERLREALRRYELLAAHSRDIFLIVRRDDGHVVECNPAAVKAYGYNREELLALTIHDLRAPGTEQLTREQMAAADSLGILFETIHRRKDGNTFPVEVSSQGVTIDGTRVLISVIRDIGDHKSAEQELAQALQRLSAHMDNSPLAVVEFDPEFRVIRWSGEAERLFGWTAEEIVGHSIGEMPWVHEEDAESVRRVAADLFSGARRRCLNVNRNYRKDGSIVQCEWYSSAIYDARGRLASVLSQVLDVTQRKAAEQALRESEERQRIALDAASLGTWRHDVRAGVVYFDSRARGHYGFEAAAVPLSEVLAKVSPEDANHLERDINVTLDPALSRVPYSTEYRIIHQQGSVRWIAVRAFVHFEGVGAARRAALVIGTSEDITQRKWREQELADARSRQELLAEIVGRLLASEEPQKIVNDLALTVMRRLECHAFLHFLVDPARDRLHLNAWAGIPAEKVREIEWLDYGEGVCGCVARDGSRIVAENIPETPDPRTEFLKSCGMQSYACHPLLASSRVIGTLGFSSRTKTHFTEDDLSLMQSVTNHIAIAMERVRAQQEIRESEARLRFAAENSPDFMFIQDREFHYVWLARAARPLPAEGFPGKTAMETIALEDPERVRDIKRRVMEQGIRYTGEMSATVGGQLRIIETTYEPWRDAAGEVVGLAGYLRDITERKRTEERLLQAQKAESIGILAGGIAHDFNNLLATVMGNASLLRDEVPDESREKLGAIIQASEKAADLTRQLLAYAGKGRFIIAPLDLSRIVHDMTELLRSAIPKKVSLRLALEPALPGIEADRGQLQQIVMNLVINAAEAIGASQSGSVTVTTRAKQVAGGLADEVTGAALAPGRYVCLDVSDTGPGMEREVRARIFDPFFTTKFMGRGLGLAAVAGIVQAHRGAIQLRTAPGEGTSFRVLLPAGASPKAERQPARDLDLSGSGTVLLVDDEPMIRNFTRAALERYGYQVLTAENGLEALQVFEQNPESVDIVVLDLMMPVMGGDEVIGVLQARRPDVKVILMSGYSESEALKMFRGKGVAGFLQKPFTANRLAREIKLILARTGGHGP